MRKEQERETDPVVAEVRAAKERLASRFDYDVREMLREAQERQQASGRRVVTLAKRQPTPA